MTTKLEGWILAAVAFMVHVATIPKWPTEWDSVSLVFGADNFDVRQASPHAPGYWLYVAAGRSVRALTPLDTHDALAVAAAAATAATVGLVYVLGRSMAGRWLGLAAAGVLLTSPFLLFYGTAVGSYAADALASTALVWLAWRARPGSWHGPAALATLGLAAGARQTSLVLLAPLAAVAAARSARTPRALALAAAAGVAGLAAWLVPLHLEQPGGLAAVREQGARIWKEAVSVTSPLYGAPGWGVRYNLGQAGGYTLMAAAAVLPVTLAGGVAWAASRRRLSLQRERDQDQDRDQERDPESNRGGPLLLVAAIVPSLVFVFVFHFGKAGYVLSYLPALVLLLLWPAARAVSRRRFTAVLTALVVVGCGVQAHRFVRGNPGLLPLRLTDRGGPWFTESRYGAPYRLTLTALDDVDGDTDRYLALRAAFDPATDALVYVHGNGGHRYRHAMLTLPEFEAHYLQAGRHEYAGHRRRWVRERDRVLELAPGGRAVLVLDEPQADVAALLAAGVAATVPLASGPTVYVVPPGNTVYGVRLEER